jgi:hypothetical protein
LGKTGQGIVSELPAILIYSIKWHVVFSLSRQGEFLLQYEGIKFYKTTGSSANDLACWTCAQQ